MSWIYTPFRRTAHRSSDLPPEPQTQSNIATNGTTTVATKDLDDIFKEYVFVPVTQEGEPEQPPTVKGQVTPTPFEGEQKLPPTEENKVLTPTPFAKRIETTTDPVSIQIAPIERKRKTKGCDYTYQIYVMQTVFKVSFIATCVIMAWGSVQMFRDPQPLEFAVVVCLGGSLIYALANLHNIYGNTIVIFKNPDDYLLTTVNDTKVWNMRAIMVDLKKGTFKVDWAVKRIANSLFKENIVLVEQRDRTSNIFPVDYK